MRYKGKTVKPFGPQVEEPLGALVEWSEEYEIGVEVIDQQHLRYFELVNKYLQQAAEYANSQDTMDRLIQSFEFMSDYAEEHFSAEESIMQRSNYPEYDTHRDEHEYFRRHIAALREGMEKNGFSPALAREVNFYAVEWFIHHILSVDTKLADFLDREDLDLDLNEFAL